jgi:hypothetical protein
MRLQFSNDTQREREMKQKLIKAAAVATVGLCTMAGVAGAAGVTESASGAGKLDNGARQFSFNAKHNANGTVTGQATLINKDFSGTNPNAPYQLKIDITCMKTVGDVAIFGGTTKRTNDPSLVDAVFFSVQDNGEPGKTDKISRAFFWDDDPTTTGDPQACQLVEPTDFPLEQIQTGNVQVKP